MNRNRGFTRRRQHLNALERLTERFEAKDESWYAERLELLGRAMFGDLWDSKRSETRIENQEHT